MSGENHKSERAWRLDVSTALSAQNNSSFCLSPEGTVEALEQLGMPHHEAADIHLVGQLHGYGETDEIAAGQHFKTIAALPTDEELIRRAENDQQPLEYFEKIAVKRLAGLVAYYNLQANIDGTPFSDQSARNYNIKIGAMSLSLTGIFYANTSYMVEAISDDRGLENLVGMPTAIGNFALAAYGFVAFRKRARRLQTEAEEYKQLVFDRKVDSIVQRTDIIVPNTANVSI
jgi:hypothetical protein